MKILGQRIDSYLGVIGISLLSRILYLSIGKLSSMYLYNLDNTTVSRSFFRYLSHWDSVLYHEISTNGYTTEHSMAFLPLLPLLAKLISQIGLDNVTSAVLLSNICFVLNSVLLYHITSKFYNRRFGFISAMFFIFNPNTILFSSYYTESLFMSLFLVGFIYKHVRLVVFSLSTLLRSNGMLFSLFFYKQPYLVPIIVAPFYIFQFFCWIAIQINKSSSSMFNHLKENIHHFELYNQVNKKSLNLLKQWNISIGPDLTPDSFISFIKNVYNTFFIPYTYIQKTYWNQGFLKFYTQKENFFNFLSGAPFLMFFFMEILKNNNSIYDLADLLISYLLKIHKVLKNRGDSLVFDQIEEQKNTFNDENKANTEEYLKQDTSKSVYNLKQPHKNTFDLNKTKDKVYTLESNDINNQNVLDENKFDDKIFQKINNTEYSYENDKIDSYNSTKVELKINNNEDYDIFLKEDNINSILLDGNLEKISKNENIFLNRPENSGKNIRKYDPTCFSSNLTNLSEFLKINKDKINTREIPTGYKKKNSIYEQMNTLKGLTYDFFNKLIFILDKKETILELLLLFQLLLLVFFIHTNITFRFISYNPIVYWYLARFYLYSKNRYKAEYIAYYITSSVIYTILYAAYYPPA